MKRAVNPLPTDPLCNLLRASGVQSLWCVILLATFACVAGPALASPNQDQKADGAGSQQELVLRIRTAIQEKSATNFCQSYCRERLTETDKSKLPWPKGFESDALQNVRFIKAREFQEVAGYEYNVEFLGYLKFEFRGERLPILLPYGKFENRFYLAKLIKSGTFPKVETKGDKKPKVQSGAIAVGQAIKEANKNNVARIANAYAFFQFKNNRHFSGPENETEFRGFLQDPRYQPIFETMKIDVANLDSLFVSERDQKKILIRWSVVGSSRGCYEAIAFEQTGVDGARIVAFANGESKEIRDKREYDALLNPPSKK